jgi:cobalt/nickel transport system permease protein
MKNRVPSFLLENPPHAVAGLEGGRLKMSFLSKGLHHIAEIIRSGYIQWELASRDGLFQKIDARVKVLFLLFFIIIVSLKRDPIPEILIGIFVFVLILLSRLDAWLIYRRVIFLSFVFGFLIAAPAVLNVFIKGEVIVPLVRFSGPHDFWIYHIPDEIGITKEGLYRVITFTLRVMNSLSLSFLVFYTTPFPELIKALRVIKAPDSFLMIITLTYKYIFIFARTVHDMHLAKKGRLIGPERDTEARRWVAGRIALMFRKSQQRCEEIYKAMIGRGFSGTIRVYGSRSLRTRDWISGLFFLCAGVFFLFL